MASTPRFSVSISPLFWVPGFFSFRLFSIYSDALSPDGPLFANEEVPHAH